MSKLLREEITPKLDKLREEKRAFLEFQKKSSELERLMRLFVASEWTALEARKTKGIETLRTSEVEYKTVIAAQGRMTNEIARMEKDGEEITKRRDEELAKGGKVQKLEDEQKALAREVALLRTKLDIGQSTITDEETRSAELDANAKEVRRRFFSFSSLFSEDKIDMMIEYSSPLSAQRRILHLSNHPKPSQL